MAVYLHKEIQLSRNRHIYTHTHTHTHMERSPRIIYYQVQQVRKHKFNSLSLVAQQWRIPLQCRDKVQWLDREDPLEEDMATHSSILARKIPCRGKRCLVGYPTCGAELDTMEETEHTGQVIWSCVFIQHFNRNGSECKLTLITYNHHRSEHVFFWWKTG